MQKERRRIFLGLLTPLCRPASQHGPPATPSRSAEACLAEVSHVLLHQRQHHGHLEAQQLHHAVPSVTPAVTPRAFLHTPAEEEKTGRSSKVIVTVLPQRWTAKQRAPDLLMVPIGNDHLSRQPDETDVLAKMGICWIEAFLEVQIFLLTQISRHFVLQPALP